MYKDAADGIIRNNIVRSKARIGVYLDACFNVTIENNILVGGSTKTWSGRNIAGIAINNGRITISGVLALTL